MVNMPIHTFAVRDGVLSRGCRRLCKGGLGCRWYQSRFRGVSSKPSKWLLYKIVAADSNGIRKSFPSLDFFPLTFKNIIWPSYVKGGGAIAPIAPFMDLPLGVPGIDADLMSLRREQGLPGDQTWNLLSFSFDLPMSDDSETVVS